MMPTAVSTIKWLRMTKVKNCNKKYCECSDKLRRLLVTRPINSRHEKKIDRRIEEQEKYYYNCFNK